MRAPWQPLAFTDPRLFDAKSVLSVVGLGLIPAQESGALAKPPALPTLPAPPTLAAPAVSQASIDQAISAAQAAGRASTIATSGQGVAGAPTTAKKSLLGG